MAISQTAPARNIFVEERCVDAGQLPADKLLDGLSLLLSMECVCSGGSRRPGTLQIGISL